MAENNPTLEERLIDIFRQMQTYITMVQGQQEMIMKMAQAIDALTTKWCPDVQRVVDEHADDIDALKASQEFIGKGIGALKKEIESLKNKPQ